MRRRLAPALALGLGLLAAGCGRAPEPPPASDDPFGGQLPVLHPLPEFSLVADDGSPLTRADLLGKVWAVCFIFTTCGDVCPAMISRVQVLQKVFPEGAALLAVTVDPEHDTPEVLSQYASFHHRVPGKWLLATGEWEAISELAQKGFYLGGGKRQLHSPRLGLVDRAGRLRGYYDTREEKDMTRIVADVNRLLAEPPPAPDPPAAPAGSPAPAPAASPGSAPAPAPGEEPGTSPAPPGGGS